MAIGIEHRGVNIDRQVRLLNNLLRSRVALTARAKDRSEQQRLEHGSFDYAYRIMELERIKEITAGA